MCTNIEGIHVTLKQTKKRAAIVSTLVYAVLVPFFFWVVDLILLYIRTDAGQFETTITHGDGNVVVAMFMRLLMMYWTFLVPGALFLPILAITTATFFGVHYATNFGYWSRLLFPVGFGILFIGFDLLRGPDLSFILYSYGLVFAFAVLLAWAIASRYFMKHRNGVPISSEDITQP